tara:strand:+ start:7931 stop:9319 length:1389 start_codon:yes stop_codon:yes gene_type:complete
LIRRALTSLHGTSETFPNEHGPVVTEADPADDWREAMRSGQALLQAGQAEEAEEAVASFERATLARPDDVAARLNLAIAAYRAGEPERAAELCDTILITAPELPDAHQLKGLALHALGDHAGALAAFRKAVAISPNSAKSWASIADIADDEDERIEAVEHAASVMLAACHESGATPSVLHRCISALISAQRFDDATSMLDSHRTRLDAVTYHDLLARTLYRKGAFEAAFRAKEFALLGMDLRSLPNTPKPSDFAPDAAMSAVAELSDILGSAGIECFLAAGTLLGMYREGRPLAHDRDADIGVMRGGDVAGVIRSHPSLMLAHDARPGDRYFALSFRNVAIDIFVHDARNDHLVCGVSSTPGDIQWRFSPFRLKRIEIAGRIWRIPDNAERYLAESYGPGWRTPDKGFASAISSPALFGVSDHARGYYALTRAKKSLLIGDAVKARALLRQSPVRMRFAMPP